MQQLYQLGNCSSCTARQLQQPCWRGGRRGGLAERLLGGRRITSAWAAGWGGLQPPGGLGGTRRATGAVAHLGRWRWQQQQQQLLLQQQWQQQPAGASGWRAEQGGGRGQLLADLVPASWGPLALLPAEPRPPQLSALCPSNATYCKSRAAVSCGKGC